MQSARTVLSELLEKSDLTAGLSVRIHGDHLILSRNETVGTSEAESVDYIRLTRLSASKYGLSVKRHTGRWERTPFSGDIEDMVSVMHTFMQHLVAPR